MTRSKRPGSERVKARHPDGARYPSTWTMTEVPASSGFRWPRIPSILETHGPAHALRRRPPFASGTAGASTPRSGRSGDLFGTSSWKYEGWLGSIYTPGRYTVRGKFSRQKFEAECLAEYARSSRRSAATSASTSSPPRTTGDSSSERHLVRSGSPSRSPRRSPSQPGRAMPATAPGPVGRTPSFLDARLFDRRVRPTAGALSRPGRRPDLRVRDHPEIDPLGHRVRRAARRLPRRPAWGISLRRRGPQPRVSRARTTSRCWPPTASRTSSTPGPGCRELAAQAELPGAFTADFTVVRALLRHGRTYETRRDPLRALSHPPGTRSRDARRPPLRSPSKPVTPASPPASS